MIKEKKIPAASTFESREEAEAALAAVIDANSKEIAASVNGSSGGRPKAFSASFAGGRVLERGATEAATGRVAVAVLVKDSRERVLHPDGVSEMTSAPIAAELVEFMSSYFHQDFLLDAAGPDAVIQAFLDTKPPRQELLALAQSMEDQVADAPSDERLERDLYRKMGCYYLPSSDGIRSRQWLSSIAARFRMAASR